MSGTRYQVFVSSTYEDLKDERREVTQALLELDCLPAGMEMFVASTDEQWTLIEEVISESDYYVLIVGGRYGSMTEEGISYTEKEFDLAIKRKIPVLVFVPKEPESIPQGKTDQNDTARDKLAEFQKKAMTGRTVAFYRDAADLGSKVSRALVQTMKKHPGVGWVRGDKAMTVEQQRQNVELRERINQLEREKLEAQAALVEDVAGLAQGDEQVTIPLLVGRTHGPKGSTLFAFTSTWDGIFREIGPMMLDEASESDLEERLELHLRYSGLVAEGIVEEVKAHGEGIEMWADDLEMVLVQLRALGLIDTGKKKRPITDTDKYLVLTDKGRRHLVTLLAVEKGKNPGARYLDDDDDPSVEIESARGNQSATDPGQLEDSSTD